MTYYRCNIVKKSGWYQMCLSIPIYIVCQVLLQPVHLQIKSYDLVLLINIQFFI